MQYLTIHNGIKMPQLGLGSAAINEFQDNADSVTKAISTAIDVGYRHIDTAALYNTEANVGTAIKRSGIDRKEFFITTKLWVDDFKYEDALKAAQKSLDNLQVDYIDLYLMHWPVQEHFLDGWNALETLYEEGLVKAIGGSNFFKKHFDLVYANGNIKPMVNQIEVSPYHTQHEMRTFCKQEHIIVTAWSPFGTGNWSTVPQEKKPLLSPAILKIAEKYNKSAAQIILRWGMDTELSMIPKSQNPARIQENFDIFDFTLTPEDIATINNENKDLALGIEYAEGNQALMKRI